MTKSEAREVRKLHAYASLSRGAAADSPEVALLARSFSALIRSARTVQSRHTLQTEAAAYVCVVRHPEFIVV
jgi:hypothetical protein